MVLARMCRKISRLAQLIENPKLFRILRKGVSIDTFLRLNRPWLLEANINTVFDIGANIGHFASLIHEILPTGTIYSFEPLQDCYKQLKKRMKKIDNFEAFNVALGDTNGELTFHKNEHLPSSSVLPMADIHKQNYPYAAKDTIIKVRSAKLDDIAEDLKIEDNLLIKIDVQGFEDKIIVGGKNTIKRASILILETSFQPLYIGQPIFEDIYDYLKEDFRYIGSLGEPRMNQIDGSPLFEDSIFVKKSSMSSI
jgi:FkbM family methyltransferase